MTFSVTSAYALSTNVVRVTLGAEPAHSSAGNPGDALNPASWMLVRLDSSAQFNVLGVSEFDTLNFDIYSYEAFGPFNVGHRITAISLVDLTGAPVVTPKSADFAGVIDREVSTPQRLAAGRNFGTRDLSNPPAPPQTGSVGGTFVVTPRGDYDLDQGQALLRKLIWRRIITRPGEFFHLPGYGLGVAEKEPIPGDLVTLQTEFERQLGEEPDVDSVSVGLLLDTQGIFTIDVAATLRQTGQDVQLSFVVPTRVAAF